MQSRRVVAVFSVKEIGAVAGGVEIVGGSGVEGRIDHGQRLQIGVERSVLVDEVGRRESVEREEIVVEIEKVLGHARNTVQARLDGMRVEGGETVRVQDLLVRHPAQSRVTGVEPGGGTAIRDDVNTAFNQFPDRPLLAMVGAALFAPLAILGIFFRDSRGQRWLATDSAPSAQLDMCARAVAGRTAAARSPPSPTASALNRPRASAAIGSCRPGSSPKPRRRCWRKPPAMPLSIDEIRAALAELDGSGARSAEAASPPSPRCCPSAATIIGSSPS